MEKEKKKWEIPKLICLYRGRPEEAVLVACKQHSEAVGGPSGQACTQKHAGWCISSVAT